MILGQPVRKGIPAQVEAKEILAFRATLVQQARLAIQGYKVTPGLPAIQVPMGTLGRQELLLQVDTLSRWKVLVAVRTSV